MTVGSLTAPHRTRLIGQLRSFSGLLRFRNRKFSSNWLILGENILVLHFRFNVYLPVFAADFSLRNDLKTRLNVVA
jgi:hypothetical protein